VSRGVELLADRVLEDRDLGDAVESRDPDADGEPAHGAGGDAAAAETGEGRQARVIPAGDDFFLHEPEDVSLLSSV